MFFGRIHPDKGTADAIDVARRSGRRLVIAGIIQDHDYFRDRVAPHLDDDRICYIGPVAAAERSTVLGGAHALLHLIHFDEPFGFSVVEALACGTPVIAYDRGSMSELIDDGMTGYLIRDTAEALRAVDAANDLDRIAIRASTVARFSRTAMVEKYDAVYRAVLNRSV